MTRPIIICYKCLYKKYNIKYKSYTFESVYNAVNNKYIFYLNCKKHYKLITMSFSFIALFSFMIQKKNASTIKALYRDPELFMLNKI